MLRAGVCVHQFRTLIISSFPLSPSPVDPLGKPLIHRQAWANAYSEVVKGLKNTIKTHIENNMPVVF